MPPAEQETMPGAQGPRGGGGRWHQCMPMGGYARNQERERCNLMGALMPISDGSALRPMTHGMCGPMAWGHSVRGMAAWCMGLKGPHSHGASCRASCGLMLNASALAANGHARIRIPCIFCTGWSLVLVLVAIGGLLCSVVWCLSCYYER